MTVVIDEPHQFGVRLECIRCGYKILYTCTEGWVSGHGTSFTKGDVAHAKKYLSDWNDFVCDKCKEKT